MNLEQQYDANNRKIESLYESWFRNLPKSKKKNPVDFRTFKIYIREEFDKDINLDTALSIFRSKKEFIKVKNGWYIDSEYQRDIASKWLNRITINFDYRAANWYRISDVYKHKHSKVITNFSFEIEKELQAVKTLNKANKELYRFYGALSSIVNDNNFKNEYSNVSKKIDNLRFKRFMKNNKKCLVSLSSENKFEKINKTTRRLYAQ